jgi:putative redox protein
MEGKHLSCSAELINEKVKFDCKVDGKDSIIVDYFPPLGDGEGYTSLELFLMSLSSCVGTTVKALINSQKLNVEDVKVTAKGTRRDEHPTAFETITLDLELKANGLEMEALKKVIKIADESICPVLALVKNNVEVTILPRII